MDSRLREIERRFAGGEVGERTYLDALRRAGEPVAVELAGEQVPVTAARLSVPGQTRDLRPLAELRWLRTLDLRRVRAEREALVGLLAAGALAGLQELSLRYARFDPGEMIARSGLRLTALDLGFTPLSDAGLRAVAAAPSLAGLTRLRVPSTRIGPAGAAALAGLARLEVLDVRHCALGLEGARALAEAPHSGLRILDAHREDLGATGTELLATSHASRAIRARWRTKLRSSA